LAHLFLGGPGVEPIVCPGETVSKPLPATGQTRCFDDVRPAVELDCAGEEFPGQDGFYRAGCPGEGRFIDHGNGTVTDSCTGLTWQQHAADLNGDGASGDQGNWGEALEYCEGLVLGGHSDWRLPNIRELQSIVDYGEGRPAIAPVFTAAGTMEYSGYWSSTSGYNNPGSAWLAYFYGGEVGREHKDTTAYVRAVRGGL
jgi:hypothetical protein